MLKGRVLSECEKWKRNTSKFQEEYQEYKQLARYIVNHQYVYFSILMCIIKLHPVMYLLNHYMYIFFFRKLVAIYREQCQEKEKAMKELSLALEQSSLSDSQKQALLDVNNDDICHGRLQFLNVY